MTRRGTLAALLATALLAGCGGSSGGGQALPVPTTGPSAALRIGLAEYRLQLSTSTLLPGQVSVQVTNTGSTQHDVSFSQGGVVLGASERLPPGKAQTLSVTVATGSPVELRCTIGGHAEAGMTASLAVAPA